MKLVNQAIVIATQNQGKIGEIKAIIQDFPIILRSLVEFGYISEPEETGKTFLENARIKAHYYAQKTGIAALADDSGLSIEQLNGEPGVYSKNWMDQGDAFAKIQQILQNKGLTSSKAYFTCVLSLHLPDQDQFIDFTGEIHGHLTFPAQGKNGFGYDPIFIPDGYEQTFGQMSDIEKNKISHRARALKQFRTFLLGQ